MIDASSMMVYVFSKVKKEKERKKKGNKSKKELWGRNRENDDCQRPYIYLKESKMIEGVLCVLLGEIQASNIVPSWH